MAETFFTKMVGRVFGALVERRVQQSLREVEQYFTVGATSHGERFPYDRYGYDRQEVLKDSLKAWRENPIARRIVELTSQYVVGSGLALSSEDQESDAFLRSWWRHRLNRIGMRTYEWCDELTRSGNLFLLVSTDVAGMSYVRAIPTAEIEAIETAPNDVAQERVIVQKAREVGEEPIRWAVYQADQDGRDTEGNFPTVALHYTVNQPVGAKWGESDLAPLVRWLRRYANWLENRVRLNYFRQLFLFIVRGQFRSEAERKAREVALNAQPPNPGSILVTGEGEEWGVLSPSLDSFEAGQDGLAVKKMIAAGAGLPMHFLAEPEGAARTTAEAAGGPTYRRFEQRQRYFLWLIEDLARVVLQRRAQVDRRVRADAPIRVQGADLSAKDNASLAAASATVVNAWLSLWDRGLVGDDELLRIAYRFVGESETDLAKVLEAGKGAAVQRGGASWLPVRHNAGKPDAPAEGQSEGQS